MKWTLKKGKLNNSSAVIHTNRLKWLEIFLELYYILY